VADHRPFWRSWRYLPQGFLPGDTTRKGCGIMTICAICKHDLPDDNFSPGLLTKIPSARKCRPCTNAATKDYHRRNPDRRRQYDKTTLENHRVMRRANRLLKSAVEHERIEKTPCVVCGKGGDTHGHHFSYEPKDWLSVIWLCSLHHKQVHAGAIDWTTLPVTHGAFPSVARLESWPEEVWHLLSPNPRVRSSKRRKVS
jgi:hypothetical protein